MDTTYSVRESADIFAADMADLAYRSEIAAIFEDATVFLTGGTGFIGKMYMEKILRSCPKVKKIYLLARPKKGKTVEKRIEEIFDSPSMVPMKKNTPNFMDKIEIVHGDCTSPDIGLDEESKKTLIEETNFVIHCAATVRFDEKIKTAAYINVRAVKDLLEMAKHMKNLKAFLHVSTAYSNCPRKEIEEKFYDPVMPAEKLLDLVEALDEERLTNITLGITSQAVKAFSYEKLHNQMSGYLSGYLTEVTDIIDIFSYVAQMIIHNVLLLGEWPNTYAFTKAIAESLIQKEIHNLPIAVLRPSIVITSYNEPIRGWIDNFYGPSGILLAGGLGLLRTLHGDPKNLADLIPCDAVVNSGIAVLWDIVNRRADNSIQDGTRMMEDPVYNCVSSAESPITWEEFMENVTEKARRVPTELQIWHECFAFRKNRYHHLMAKFFLHTVPAHLVDFICWCIGREQMMVKGYQKLDKLGNVGSYFILREWRFTNVNVQKLWQKMDPEDQKLFRFSMKNFNWDEQIYFYVRGARVYLLKDPLDTIPKGRVKYWKLFVAHYALIALLLFLLFKLLCLLLSFIF